MKLDEYASPKVRKSFPTLEARFREKHGNKFDYIELPETVVAARKIPTFKDIEKQIGRKIT